MWVHRLGLGGWERLLGLQWMLITTTGRRTGRVHRVMVDVLGYDEATDTYFVEAAYGRRADWYRNIQANPVFRVQVGRHRFAARATPLSPDRGGELIVRFFRRRPTYTKAVLRMVGVRVRTEEDLKQLGRSLLLLAVSPVDRAL